MPKTRKEKEVIVAEIAEKFRSMKSASFSKVSGFTMPQANELREKAAEAGVEVFIAKKTLLDLAAKEAGVEGLDPKIFEGSILTAIGEDEVSAAKVVNDFNKQYETLTFVGGVLEGQVIGVEEVTKLAALPTKDQLLAQMVGSLNAPISGFVNVLAGNLRGLVNVLNSIKDAKSA
ncbi:MAG: 50S ribosomal protein L10 [Patescibacteria group bacterium]